MTTAPDPTLRRGAALLHAAFAVATAVWLLFTVQIKLWQALLLVACLGVVLLLSAFLAHRGGARRVRWAWLGWVPAALVAGHLSVGALAPFSTGFRLDDRLGWGLQANLRDFELPGAEGPYRVTSDALGYRNARPYPADGRLPVIVQGDSNGFGVGLDDGETFCDVYAELTGTPCTNFGVNGYDPQHHYFQYRDVIAPRFTVGRRIVLLYLGNDYTMAATATPYLVSRPYLRREGARLVPVPQAPMPFVAHVYGNHFIEPYGAYDAGMATARMGVDWGHRVPAWLAHFRLFTFFGAKVYPKVLQRVYGAFAADALAAGRRLTPYYPIWQIADAAEWPEPYAAFRQDWIALLRALAAQHPDTVIVAFPMRDQIVPDDDSLRQRLAADGHPPESLDRLALNRLLAEAARDGALHVIDTTDALLAADDKESLYQRKDEHLSPRGMRLVVETALSRMR